MQEPEGQEAKDGDGNRSSHQHRSPVPAVIRILKLRDDVEKAGHHVEFSDGIAQAKEAIEDLTPTCRGAFS